MENSVQIRLPSSVCDFFEVTATIAEGSGESLNRLPVGPRDLILADAGYCTVPGVEHVWQHGLTCWFNPQSFVAYSAHGRERAPNCCALMLFPYSSPRWSWYLACKAVIKRSNSGILRKLARLGSFRK